MHLRRSTVNTCAAGAWQTRRPFPQKMLTIYSCVSAIGRGWRRINGITAHKSVEPSRCEYFIECYFKIYCKSLLLGTYTIQVAAPRTSRLFDFISRLNIVVAKIFSAKRMEFVSVVRKKCLLNCYFFYRASKHKRWLNTLTPPMSQKRPNEISMLALLDLISLPVHIIQLNCCFYIVGQKLNTGMSIWLYGMFYFRAIRAHEPEWYRICRVHCFQFRCETRQTTHTIKINFPEIQFRENTMKNLAHRWTAVSCARVWVGRRG